MRELAELNVLIVDDHFLFREGLAVLIRRMHDVTNVYEASDGKEARGVLEPEPELDIVLLDIGLPDVNGMTLLHALKSEHPEIPVAMLSGEYDSALIQEALHTGASGFITKNASFDVLYHAINLILSGGIYIPPELLENPANNQSEEEDSGSKRIPDQSVAPETVDYGYRITDRQKDVLSQMGKGLSNKEIARALDMSPSTVKVHVAAILREFDVKNRTQAVTLAREYGIIAD